MISYEDILSTLEELSHIKHYQNVIGIVGDNKELQNYIVTTINTAVEDMSLRVPQLRSKSVKAEELEASIDSKYDTLINSLRLLGRHDEAEELERLHIKYMFDNLDAPRPSRVEYHKLKAYKNNLKKTMIDAFIHKFNLSKTKSTQLAAALIATL